MKVIVLGANGQVGRCLQDTAPDGLEIIYLNRSQCNLEDLENCAAPILQHRPDAVINAAAYTQVDKAEQEPELANRINGEAVGIIASACEQVGAKFIQISTDYVFDGTSSVPYKPDDPINPINQYGRSKALGEKLALANCARSIVVRTSWVYSQYGHNFFKTMLRLMQEREEISVVCDQIGTPAYAGNLARCLWKFVLSDVDSGVFHFTDAGVASWYDFAVAIYEQAKKLNLIEKETIVSPITGSKYPALALRPAYAVLDKEKSWHTLEIKPHHWQVGLSELLNKLK